jgi:hypothetical protein
MKSLDRTSTNGIQRLIRGRDLSPITTSHGYKRLLLADIGFGRKNKSVHRLVAKAFIPNPDEYDIINHIDGDKENNHYSNLEWCTHLHNITHAINTGVRFHSPRQVLTEEDFNETDLNYSEIGRMYNCSGNSIKLVVIYISYKHIEPEKKNTYKINYLKGKELKKWLKSKACIKKK